MAQEYTIKQAFQWAIPSNPDEIQAIWSKAIFTVDTNVLLDLYQVHPDTRKSIIEALKKHEDRLWLAHQVAYEFFKNRNRVISNAIKEYGESEEILRNLEMEIENKIENSIQNTLNKRLISKDFKKKIIDKIKNSINLQDEIQEQLQSIKIDFSQDNDVILDEILGLFNNKFGKPFDIEKQQEVENEANRRIQEKIPPGFEDSKKDNKAQYGDYILWRQILDYAKEHSKPIVMITSEQKEDWWHKIDGNIVGVRPELRKEFFDYCSQDFLLYRTENFLRHCLEQDTGKNQAQLNKAIEEIKNLNRRESLLSSIQQEVILSNDSINIGYIICYLNKNTKYFTVSGHFNPNLTDIPKIKVSLEGRGIYGTNLQARTGTKYDFNIHLRSYNEMLPEGEYVFRYVAYTNVNDIEKCPNCDGYLIKDLKSCFDCHYEVEACIICHKDLTFEESEECSPFCSYHHHKINQDD